MRLAARTDGNQIQIVNAFRGQGCSVQVLSQVGKGCPDLLVGGWGVSVPVECKDGDNSLTPDQQKWFKEWRGSKAIIRRLEDVGLLCKAMRIFGPMAKALEKENK